MLEFIKKFIQLFLGYMHPDIPGKKKFKIDRLDYEYLVYLVNTRYNQRKSQYGELDKYSDTIGVGLATYVKRAAEKVKKNPDLIQKTKVRKKFISQPHQRVAKSLCNTIIRYIYMELCGVDLPTFEDYYIDRVNHGCYKPDKNGDLTKLTTSDPRHKLIIPFMKDAEYWEDEYNANFTNAPEMIDSFVKNKDRLGFIREGNTKRSTHTYLMAKFKGKVKRFDTYRTDLTGENVLDITKYKIWWSYGY